MICWFDASQLLLRRRGLELYLLTWRFSRSQACHLVIDSVLWWLDEPGKVHNANMIFSCRFSWTGQVMRVERSARKYAVQCGFLQTPHSILLTHVYSQKQNSLPQDRNTAHQTLATLPSDHRSISIDLHQLTPFDEPASIRWRWHHPSRAFPIRCV